MTTESRTFDFSSAIQKQIVAMLIMEDDPSLLNLDVVRPELFDHDALSRVVTLLFNFRRKYQRHPSLEEIASEFEELLAGNPRLPEEEYRAVFAAVLEQADGNFDYVRDKVVAFARHQTGRNLAAEITEALRKGKAVDWEEYGDKLKQLTISEEIKGGLVIIASEQRSRKMVTYLWKDKFQNGKLTLIVGDPSSGKSLFGTYMAANISAGRTWPDGAVCEKGRVLMIQGEEDWEEVVKARLEQYGADESLVHEVIGVKDSSGENRIFSLQSDIAALRKAIVDFGDVKAIFIDPIQGYFGGARINSNSDAHVRSVLMPLAQLASETNVAIIGISHLNKVSSKDEVKAMYRTGGSIGIMAVARTVWLMVWDGAPDGLRYLQRVKNSLKAGLSGMALHIVPDDHDDLRGGDVIFHDEVSVPPAQELLRLTSGAAGSAHTLATQQWCRNRLASGSVDATTLYTAAKAELRLGEQPVRRALRAIGAVSAPSVGSGWVWSLVQ